MIETIPDLFFHALKQYGTRPMLLVKRGGAYVPRGASEVEAAVREISLGFLALGLKPGAKVAIIAETRLEWVLVDLAVLTAGGVDVTVYPTLTAAQTEYILNDSDTEFVVASTADQLAKVQAIRGRLPRVRHLIGMDVRPEGPDGLTLDDLRARGAAENPARHRTLAASVRGSDLASLIYTSGTTGEPKGVMLTHKNLAADVEAVSAVFPTQPDDVALSFLPLSHVYERSATYYYLYNGVTLAHAESLDAIAANLLEVRPTLLTAVPRVLEKVYAKIHEGVARAGLPRRRLFGWAIKVGEAYERARRSGRVPPWLVVRHAVADRLVFRKIRARLGGRLRHIVSGSAPLAPPLAEFFTTIGIAVLEGYGLTETSPTLTVNPADAPRIGTVGRPLPGVEISIAPDGEILARGPILMAGYYKKDEATRQVLAGGWFHTGDIGHLDPDGYLVITDRKKDVIITAGGKKVAPQPLENRLVTHELISQVMIIGNRRPFPALLIVPDFGALTRWAAANGVGPASPEALVEHPAVLRRYEAIVEEVNKDLAQFERIKKFALLPEEFTIQGGELTPTQKIKRAAVEARYRALIDRLYAQPAET